jgi:hypothetical protein
MAFDRTRFVAGLRALDPDQNAKALKWLVRLTDDEVVAQLFRNARGDAKSGRGKLLSTKGRKFLKQVYNHWEVTLDHAMTARQQLRFARACRLPYHYTEVSLLTFEEDVGVWLSLIQGDIDLMDNVLPEY